SITNEYHDTHINITRIKPRRPGLDSTCIRARARTTRRFATRLPKLKRINGRTKVSKTTSEDTGFEGSKNVGVRFSPSRPKPWTEPGCMATREVSTSPN